MTRLEAFIDAVLAPEPPLPPVAATSAAAAIDALLARAPRANAIALRATTWALGPARRPRARRLRRLHRVGAALPLARPLLDGARTLAALAYYGDDEVRRCLP